MPDWSQSTFLLKTEDQMGGLKRGKILEDEILMYECVCSVCVGVGGWGSSGKKHMLLRHPLHLISLQAPLANISQILLLMSFFYTRLRFMFVSRFLCGIWAIRVGANIYSLFAKEINPAAP